MRYLKFIENSALNWLSRLLVTIMVAIAKPKLWLKGLIAGLVTGLAGAILGLTSLGMSLEQDVGLSWLFKLRGPVPAAKDMIVVAIDDQTGGQLGLSKLPREWPRSVHGRLVENLTRQGVSVIVFDFDFQQAKQPEEDLAFAEAVAKSGRVVLTEKLVGKRQRLINSSGKQTGSVWVEQVLLPIPALAVAAKGIGPFPLPKVQVAVHQFWTFKQSVRAPTMPAVALQIRALAVYPQLTKLLKKAGTSPPQALANTARATEMLSLMRELRSVFDKTPELGKTLRKMLGNEQSPELTGDERLLLQALVGLYEGEDHRYLNFYGPPGSVTTIPYHLLAGDPEPDSLMALPDLTGKVVFVGFSDLYDPGQPDRFYTVFTNDEGVDLSGVEIAATAYGNLLTNSSLRPPGLMMEIMILALFGGIAGTFAFLLPAIVGVPLILILAALYGAVVQQVFTVANVWLPLAIPLLVQLPMALFGGLIVQYFSERRKKNRVTRAIGLYLPENLVRDFTEKNLDQSALNRVTFSVCFASDMAGFTTIAETLKPKELAAFLNDYFETLSAPLRRHGVDVIEFRADGIMCAWTAEQSEPGIRRKALLAGLEAVEAITRFRNRHDEFSHSLRIGLEVGMAYVGHAGGGGHYVYSIVGDCANTAARIEGLNKHLKTQLLASRAALEGVDDFLCRFLGEFRFVGKTDPLAILEVVALKRTASDSQRQLCDRFDKAMAVLLSGDRSMAGEAFNTILQDYPEDGPSLFHLDRCRRAVERPTNELPWIIHMDKK